MKTTLPRDPAFKDVKEIQDQISQVQADLSEIQVRCFKEGTPDDDRIERATTMLNEARYILKQLTWDDIVPESERTE